MCGPDAGPAMLHQLVGAWRTDGELTQVVANHLGLDLQLVESLIIVYTHCASHDSGRMIMIHRYIFTTSVFSIGGASFLVLQKHFISEATVQLLPLTGTAEQH